MFIDDTPEVVTLSGVDRFVVNRPHDNGEPSQRWSDPSSPYQWLRESSRKLTTGFVEYGEGGCYESWCAKPPSDLMKIMGRLQFRTSYKSKTFYRHSIEVAKLSGIVLAELGENAAWQSGAGSYMISVSD